MLYRMRNPIMTYAWGSRTAIAQLQGRPAPTSGPEAELWMGGHPKAPSEIRRDGRWIALDRAIAEDPEGFLGERIYRRFGDQLPFLLKVLAAGAPLSIQAHPDMAMAAEGYNRENSRRIPFDNPKRSFKDPRHKPELILAMTPFWALCGFRPVDVISNLLAQYCPTTLDALAGWRSKGNPSGKLSEFVAGWFQMTPQQRRLVLDEACVHAESFADAPEAQWVIRLNEVYPGDPGVLMPLILNLVRLAPGQALALQPRTFHAYLDGTGIEVMANSDNVLRGGLTPKHVDVDLLLKVVRFEPCEAAPAAEYRTSTIETRFEASADEFALSRIQLDGTTTFTQTPLGAPMILLCTKGQATVTESGQTPLDLTTGNSLFVSAGANEITITGQNELFKVSVPAVA